MDDEVEVMLRMHAELGSEILQSVQFQNRVILSGAIVAVIYGLQFSGVLPQLTQEDPTFEPIIVTLPPVITTSIAPEIVEQSRMIRASGSGSLRQPWQPTSSPRRSATSS